MTTVRVGFTGLLLPLLIAACGSGEDLTQPNGAVEVTTTTVNGSGAAAYQVTLQGRAGAALAPVSLAENDTAVVSDLAVGEVDVTLAGVATGCAVEGTNPRTVTVVEGVQAVVAFRIVCSGETPTGSLEVGVTSTGDPADGTGYTVLVDPDVSQPLGTSDTVTIAGLAAGDHLVRLADVADNCSVQSDNPRTVTIAAGEAAHTAFEVICRGALAGRIAYVSDRYGEGYDILLRNADGSGTGVDLTNTPDERDREPAWSPDGTKLCFHQDDDFTSDVIFLLDVATGRRTPLHTGFPGARGCRWSPDGTRILFWSVGDTPEHLVVMAADGANPRAIASFDSFDGYDWSPDGRQVAFVGHDFFEVDGDVPDLFVANADGTHRVNLTGNVDRNTNGADWSPDGRWIAFMARVPDGTGEEIYLIDPATREELALTGNPSMSYRSTAWSPDGSTLAFVRDRSPDFEVPIEDIYTIRADRTGLRNVTNAPQSYFDLSWSSDGQRLLFTADFAVGIINSDGTGRRALTVDNAANFEPAWGP